MSTPGNAQGIAGLSAGLKEVLASSLSTLGRVHNGEYVLNRHCLESVKDIIRFLRRDNESYEIRRYLGQAKVVQNDLIHIIKACPTESEDLFDLTVRLLTTLTSPVALLYGEEIPAEKIGRSIYMALIEHLQDYKEAFYDIDFWNVICGKLTDLFEIDWAERSESQCLQIEKMLVLLRNVLDIPPDPDREKITESDISIHDKILWSLRQSQILEFLLYASSNKCEQRYYLHLLEIFSLILREQNPKLLASSELHRSNFEKEKDMKDLLALREMEKIHKNKFKHTRTFDSTLVLKGLKSFSGKDIIYHGSLKDMKESVVPKDKKRAKPRNNKIPIHSEQIERRSSFSVRIFLKEFCIEFLNCSYNNLMCVVKEKLLAGKGLPGDETFYFWALKFFLEFNCTYNLDIKLISDSVNVQTFHFLHTNMDENFEKLVTEKKKRTLWVRKLHCILRAYHSLLQTLKWMDLSKDAMVREMSSVLKSQVFYVAEYRDMSLLFLTRYDPDIFSVAYLRDLIETMHISMKLLEEYTKHNKIVVRKKIRKKSGKKKKKKKKKIQKARPEPVAESNEEKWDRIKSNIQQALKEGTEFPDVPPFDVLSELSDEEQKKKTMKKVQVLLHEGKVVDSISLLRSARHMWPENGHFGNDGISVEEEVATLQEICLADLGNEIGPTVPAEEENEEEEEEEEEYSNDEEEGDLTDDDLKNSYKVLEEGFDMVNYKKQLVNKRVVEACAVLLQNYAKNSDYTNHCVIKVLFRIGWECGMPAMMYQASLFFTLLSVMNDKYRNYKEINDFTVHLMRKFHEHASKNNFAFAELLFWKDPSIALDIQDQLGASDMYDNGDAVETGRKGRKAAAWSLEEENELQRLWKECDIDLNLRKKIEWLKSNMIDETKSLISIKKKLRDLGLITYNPISSLKTGSDWSGEEVEELKRYFNEFRGAVDIISVIFDNLTVKRTKKSIRNKLMECGLVKNITELRKRKNRARKSAEDDSPQESDGEIFESPHLYSLEEKMEALKKVGHMKSALEWLRDTIQESIEEDDEEINAYPLLALEQEQADALETDVFAHLLRRLGFEEPGSGQVYWKIPKMNKTSLEESVNLLNTAINGEFKNYDSSDSDDEFEKLKRMMPSQMGKNKSKIDGKTNDSDYVGNAIKDLSGHDMGDSYQSNSDDSDGEFKSKSTRKSRLIHSDSESETGFGNIDSGGAGEGIDGCSPKGKDGLCDGKDFDSLIDRDEEPFPGGSGGKHMKKRRCISSDSEENEINTIEIGKSRKRIKAINFDSDEDGVVVAAD